MFITYSGAPRAPQLAECNLLACKRNAFGTPDLDLDAVCANPDVSNKSEQQVPCPSAWVKSVMCKSSPTHAVITMSFSSITELPEMRAPKVPQNLIVQPTSVHAGMTSVAQLQNGLAQNGPGQPALPGLPGPPTTSADPAVGAEAGDVPSPTSAPMNGSVPAKKVAHTAPRPSASHSAPAKRGPGRPPKKP